MFSPTFYGIALILLGILAAPSFILSKTPEAKGVLDKIAPFQGWIGLVFCLTGLISVVQSLRYMSLLIKFVPVLWFTGLATGVMLVLLGFILAYPLIIRFASNNEQAKAKADQLIAKLAPMQGKLGLGGIVLGIWCVIASFTITPSLF
jgi:hypothetical protein